MESEYEFLVKTLDDTSRLCIHLVSHGFHLHLVIYHSHLLMSRNIIISHLKTLLPSIPFTYAPYFSKYFHFSLLKNFSKHCCTYVSLSICVNISIESMPRDRLEGSMVTHILNIDTYYRIAPPKGYALSTSTNRERYFLILLNETEKKLGLLSMELII